MLVFAANESFNIASNEYNMCIYIYTPTPPQEKISFTLSIYVHLQYNDTTNASTQYKKTLQTPASARKI